jgi:hypothetical protein
MNESKVIGWFQGQKLKEVWIWGVMIKKCTDMAQILATERSPSIRPKDPSYTL